MTVDLPLLPIDPTEVGPRDLAQQAVADARETIGANPYVSGGIAAVSLGIWAWAGFWTPSLPNWLKVAILASLAAGLIAWYLGKGLGDGLHSVDDVLLSQQNPLTGDQQLTRVSPSRFADMDVVNRQGVEKDRQYLHTVVVNGVQAYEVDRYYPDQNTAVASWQAGVSNSEMRRKAAAIDRVKGDLEREANKSLEVLANNPDIVREQTAQVANRLIQITEGIETPADGGLHDMLAESIDEADPSKDLIGDIGTDGTPDGDLDDVDGAEGVELNGGASADD